MDIILHKTCKNAEIEIIVEDDLITTAKVYIGDECVACDEISTESNPNGLPFNKKNYDRVVDMMKADVEQMWNENLAAIGR